MLKLLRVNTCSLHVLSLQAGSPFWMATSQVFNQLWAKGIQWLLEKFKTSKKTGCEMWSTFPNIEKSGVSKTWGQIAVLGLYVRGSVYQVKGGAAVSVFQVLDSLSVKFGFLIPVSSGIPTSIWCIPESKAQDSGFHSKNWLDSGFHKTNLPDNGIQIPFYGWRGA